MVQNFTKKAKKKQNLISLSSTLITITIALTITLLIGLLATGLNNPDRSAAITPAGDFIGICANQYVRGNIYVKYETFDNTIEKVDFYIDDKKIRSEYYKPYSLAGNNEDASDAIYPYNTSSLSDGEHTLKAVIEAQRGIYTDTIKFNVANRSPEKTQNQFLGVCNNQIVSGPMYIQFLAQASNTDRVELELTGPNDYRYTKTEQQESYSLGGTVQEGSRDQMLPFETDRLREGTYKLVARRYSTSGSRTTRELTFKIDRSGPTVATATPRTTPRSTNSTAPTSRASATPAASSDHQHPTDQPTPSNRPNTPNNFIQVDARSTTDNQVNSYLKNLLDKTNPRELIASGAWWGPTDQFFVNQMWTVNRTAQIAKVHPTTSTQDTSATCLLPGLNSSSGDLSKNFIVAPSQINGTKPPRPQIRVGYGGTSDGEGIPSKSVNNNEAGRFVTINHRVPSDMPSYELRLRCQGDEGRANVFRDGSPIINDDLASVMGIGQWRNRVGTDIRGGEFNHGGLPLRYTSLNLRAWYQKEGYVHLNIDGGEQIHNGRTTQLDNKALIGATVRGTLKIRGYGWKGSSVPSLGAFLGAREMPVHHLELRIEQNNEDYVVADRNGNLQRKIITSGTGTLHRQATDFELDTTMIAEGWHIISYHTHAIDKGNPAPYRDKQLAAEVKFPICVDNDNRNDCRLP